MSEYIDCTFLGDQIRIQGRVLGDVRFGLDEFDLFLREDSYVEIEDERCKGCATDFEQGWGVDSEAVSIVFCDDCQSDVIEQLQEIVDENQSDIISSSL